MLRNTRVCSERERNDIYCKGNCALICMFSCYLIMAICLAASISNKAKLVSGQYNANLINWKLNPILKIEVIDGDQLCQVGYEKIYNLEWPGTKEGCDCRDASHWYYEGVRYGYTAGECNYNETLAGCTEQYGQKAMALNKWYEKKVICVERMKDWGFEDSLKVKSGARCQTGYKKCGTATEENKMFCIPNGKTCPISEFTIQTQRSYPFDDYDKEVKFYDNQYIYYGSESANGPLTEFKVGDNYQCQNGFFAMYPNEKLSPVDYDTWKQTPDANCKVDTRFKRTAKIIEKELYRLNGALMKMMRVTEYPISDTNLWGLDQRSYVAWNQKCKSEFATIADKQDNLENIKAVQNRLYNMTLAFLILGFVAVIIISICCGAVKRSFSGLFRSVLYLALAIKVVYLPFAVNGWLTSKKEISFFTDIASKDCTDEMTNANFIAISDICSSVAGSNMGFIVWAVVFLVVEWCFKRYIEVITGFAGQGYSQFDDHPTGGPGLPTGGPGMVYNQNQLGGNYGNRQVVQPISPNQYNQPGNVVPINQNQYSQPQNVQVQPQQPYQAQPQNNYGQQQNQQYFNQPQQGQNVRGVQPQNNFGQQQPNYTPDNNYDAYQAQVLSDDQHTNQNLV